VHLATRAFATRRDNVNNRLERTPPGLAIGHGHNPGRRVLPEAQRLIGLIERAFLAGGGDFNCGRRLPELLGDGAEVAAEIVALPPGHAYLRLPLQFAASLEPKLLDLVERDDLVRLRAEAEREIADSGRWGTTFTPRSSLAALLIG